MTDPNRILPPGKIPGEILGDLLRKYPVRDERVLIGPGIGRDSAAIRFGDAAVVVKTDPITFPTDRSVIHLVHINANDIACQGAIPRWLLVTALLPEGITTAGSTASMFGDLMDAAHAIGVEVIGGHTEVTIGLDRPILVGTMLGEAAVNALIDPARAKPGDRLLVTKSAGIEGTALLASGLRSRLVIDVLLEAALFERAANMLVEPGISILAEAKALHLAGAVSALHDPTEGGIATAVRELASAAGCGAIVNRDLIPIAPETQSLTDALGIDPLGLLSSGSLLAAVPQDRVDAAEAALHNIGVSFAWIGKLTPAALGLRLRGRGSDGDLPEFEVDELARVLTG